MKKYTYAPIAALILLASLSSQVYAWTQHGIDWSFPQASDVVARDFDGDGDPDAAGISLSGTVNWYENNGQQQFTEHLIAQGLSNARYLAAGDLDNDGDLDLVIACFAGWPNPIGLYRLMNNGAMQFTVVQMNSTYRFYDLAVLDMDEDDDPDIVGTYSVSFGPVLCWWENTENGQVFVEHTLLYGVGNGFGAADVDLDGDMDLVSSDDGSILWLENNGDQTFMRHLVGSGLFTDDVNAGDLDGDGDMDILAKDGDYLRWYHNDGNQTFSQVSAVLSPLLMSDFQVMDVDGDGCMDVSGISEAWGYVWWIENILDQYFQPQELSQPSVGTVSYDTCDFNGDGRVDFAVTGTMTANNIQWYENTLNPTVKLWVTPLNTPIVIPPQGGEFSFDVWIWNTTSDTLPTDFWTAASDAYYGIIHREPVILIPDIVLAPDTLVSWHFTQRIPSYVPSNGYVYSSNIGEFPHQVVDYGNDIYFTKERPNGDAGPAVEDWSYVGEAFSEEIGGTSASGRIASKGDMTKHVPPSISPNPFNSTAIISFELRATSFVNLKVYDTAGRLVATLVDGWREAGEHRVTFDGEGLASGVYFCKVSTKTDKALIKMVYAK